MKPTLHDAPFIKKIIKRLQKKNLIPVLPENMQLSLPAIHNVELYLSFHGNDCCAHCITNSGPHRHETMSPALAEEVVQHIATYSVMTRLRGLLQEGDFYAPRSDLYRRLSNLERPPAVFTEALYQNYSDCLMGKGNKAYWMQHGKMYPFNFGRPSLRISGGEFYTWPHRIDGKEIDESERLTCQKELLDRIRKLLPEHDLYILTNGRFAEDNETAEKVISYWQGEETSSGGRTHLCISLDPFHRPPSGSTKEAMLAAIWSACHTCGIPSPFLYGVPNYRIMRLGRALKTFNAGRGHELCGRYTPNALQDYLTNVQLDPVDLVSSDGCNELKGFICNTPFGGFLANNIVLLPSGHLAYCCACVGDFGNFAAYPQKTLASIVTDPVAMMLRRRTTAIDLLQTAADLDASITLYQEGVYGAVTGSTCYQMLSGSRVDV